MYYLEHFKPEFELYRREFFLFAINYMYRSLVRILIIAELLAVQERVKLSICCWNQMLLNGANQTRLI